MLDVHIRPVRAEDAPALYQAATESVNEIFTWLPWCHPNLEMWESEDWTEGREGLFEDGTEYDFAIVDAEDRFLGVCSINQINPFHRFANVGYWIRTSHSGRGIVPYAVRKLAAFAFEKTDLVRLEIVCAVGNVRSQRAAEKAGAFREGVARDRLVLHGVAHDAVIYSIVRSRWDGS